MLATATLLELARDSAATTTTTTEVTLITTTNAPQIYTISVHNESTSIILRKSRWG